MQYEVLYAFHAEYYTTDRELPYGTDGLDLCPTTQVFQYEYLFLCEFGADTQD